MLVLTRQEADSILIGDDVEVTVLEIRGDRVKIGISAPGDIDIYRTEVYVTLNRPLSLRWESDPHASP